MRSSKYTTPATCQEQKTDARRVISVMLEQIGGYHVEGI
jgi:hypothetical protein